MAFANHIIGIYTGIDFTWTNEAQQNRKSASARSSQNRISERETLYGNIQIVQIDHLFGVFHVEAQLIGFQLRNLIVSSWLNSFQDEILDVAVSRNTTHELKPRYSTYTFIYVTYSLECEQNAVHLFFLFHFC